MPDNLVTAITIDRAKLRADVAFAKEELRQVTQAVKDAAKAGDVAGVQTGSVRQEELTQQIVKTNQQLRTNTALTKENTVANKEAALTAQQFGIELTHLAHAAGLPTEGLRALRLGFAALAGVELIRGLTAASSKISDLIALSRETRFDPNTITAFSLALERAGGKAEDAKIAVKSFGDAILAQQKQVDAIQRQAGGIFSQTLAGGGTHSQATEALNKAMTEAYRTSGILDSSLARLGVTAGRFAGNADGMRQALQTAATELVKLNQSASEEADILSRDVFKKPYADLAPALEAAAKGSLALLESQLGMAKLTKEQIAANKEYQTTVNELTGAWDAFARKLIETVGPAITFVFDKFSAALQLAKDLFDYFSKTGYPVELSDTAKARIAAGQDYGGGGDLPTGASGGYIRGPGSGTSDSIMARLSNGEFVMNAGSVRRLGVGFLQGLNSFAGGGLVGRLPSFAAGGLVATAGGATVNLHFPGGSFQLRADNEIVAGLVREGRRAGMLSAGRMPGGLA